MEDAVQQERLAAFAEALVEPGADRPEARADAEVPAWGTRLRHFASLRPVKVAIVCSLLITAGYMCSAFQTLAPSGFAPLADKEATSQSPAAPKQPAMKLKYFACHPFNLMYRMSLQTLFGLPGETVGRIPLLYSTYELEVLLRTVDTTALAPRNWTSLQSFGAQEPVSAFLYAASALTTPRATLMYTWMYERSGIYKLVRNLEVDVVDTTDRLSMGGLRRVLRHLGWAAPGAAERDGTDGQPSDAATQDAATATAAAPSSSEPSGSGGGSSGSSLGVWLFPLTFLCPGAVTCFLALAVVDAAPIAAGWIFVTGCIRGLCEAGVLLHSARLVWRRRPGPAVQALTCSHVMPFMLGCHALLALRLAAAVLPARAFVYVAFHMYGTWVPLAGAGIMLLALQPNNGHLLEGAMDGIRHLGHRAAEDLHAAAHVAGVAVGATPVPPPARRQHWPPPVRVPAALQEEAEHAPKHLLCPITHHVLTEPAVTLTGATYERSAIVEWLSKAGKDPLTGHALSSDEVFPNLAMYSIVEEYVREWTKAH